MTTFEKIIFLADKIETRTRPREIYEPIKKALDNGLDCALLLCYKNTIKSPLFGLISPVGLSGGVKTLILIANDSKHVFNASNCGDNCAKWILEIAKQKDITINFRHIMNFGNRKFHAKILNTGDIVKDMDELLHVAYKFV